MNYFITGGLGFVGRHLSNFLLQAGDKVTAVGLRKDPQPIEYPDFRYLAADTTKPGSWQEAVGDHNVIVNLAGKTIFKRWTEKYKRLIYDSRILTTGNLVDALPAGSGITFLSTSAVGYYGSRGDEILDESTPPGEDFLAKLAKDWEQEALKAEVKGARVVLTRFGTVLAKDGGAMAKMIPAFRCFVGGPLGNGTQWFPWIHMHDLLAAYKFAVEHQELGGPLNFCAPQPVRNKEFAHTLGRALHRPACMPAPTFMIRLLLGEFGETILNSQRAVPAKLEQSGFTFTYAYLDSAIGEIVKKEAIS
jgi:uncharacterized protein (TIGR01777 family)